MARRVILVVSLVLGFVPALAPPGWACSCAPRGTRFDLAEAVDAVFTGIVEESSFDTGGRPWRFDFTVELVYKGDIGPEVRIKTGNQQSACGVAFVEGDRYTVFASMWKGSLWTSSCSSPVHGDIDPYAYRLPDGRTPPPAGPDPAAEPVAQPDDEPTGYAWWVYPGGVLFGILGGLLAVRWLRRRRS